MEDFNLNELIEAEVNKRMGEKLNEIDSLSKCIEKLTNKNEKLTKDNSSFKSLSGQIKDFKKFKATINEENIRDFIKILNLRRSGEPTDGMDSEEADNLFKIVWEFYPDRDIVFNMFDFFNIKYNVKYKNFKMPYDLDKKFILDFVKDTRGRYICNGQNFNRNFGFFYKSLSGSNFKVEEILMRDGGFYNYIPWQLTLKNRYFQDVDVITKVLEKLKKDPCNANYYYRLPEYQEMPKDTLRKMTLLLPKSNLYDSHKSFLKHNMDILNTSSEIADRFKGNICSNSYSPFYYAKFHSENQIAFIKKNESFVTQVKMIKDSTLTKDEKESLVQELALKDIRRQK